VSSTSLTQTEAVRRAALLTVHGYDVQLELSEAETFRSRSTVRFTCAEPGAETFAELAEAITMTATLNGAPVSASAVDGNRIRLTGLAADNELVVEATLPCVTSGDGMHRYVDPADGATYVAAFCGMDLAQRVFACFDQPDLKAPITLSVRAPGDWNVLANGRPLETDDPATDKGVRRFATTPPLPTYLFVVCAGPWHSVSWEFRDLPFAWHARRSLAADLDASADELRRITEACFVHYTEAFDEPFGFDSYDQVFVQGLNWGAVETPGCVTFRDELLFRGQASAAQSQQRAMIIAHEMAHMWFGDLATLRWWEDAWLNESFADYMGFLVASTAAGFDDAWTGFTLQEEPRGYAADERRSTHPVAQDRSSVHDTDTAFSNFDKISYAKGNAVLRQLATWLGDEAFLKGANAYLTRHRWANAELDNFLDALAGATDRDVRRWAQAWLRTTGFDTLRLTREDGVPVLHREGSRPHRTAVDAYALEDGRLRQVATRLVDIDDAAPVRFDEWHGLVVVPNSQDHTFARIRLDDESWQAVAAHLSTIEDAQVRAVLWATALDQARTGGLHPDELLRLVGVNLAAEPHPSVWEGVFSRCLGLLSPLVSPEGFGLARQALAEICAATLRAASAAGDDSLVLPATRGLAACTSDAELLLAWLDTGHTDTGHTDSGRSDGGVQVDADLRWRVLRRLAELGAIDQQRIDAEAAADPSTEAEAGAARARAAVPTAEAKEKAWKLLAADDVPNRVFSATAEGFWVPEQADLVTDYVDIYFTAAPAWAARRGQGFSLVVGGAFPRLEARAETALSLAEALAGDVPTVLRRSWEDHLDDLHLALAARSAQSAQA
jgi:aminopeptidase N